MDIKKSTFYDQVKDNQDKEQQEAFIKDKIRDISYQYPYYGYRRITAQLKREKVVINHKWVLRMIRQVDIQTRLRRRYTTITHSKHSNRVYPNLIKDFIPNGINQAWCIDINSISILSVFVYLLPFRSPGYFV